MAPQLPVAPLPGRPPAAATWADFDDEAWFDSANEEPTLDSPVVEAEAIDVPFSVWEVAAPVAAVSAALGAAVVAAAIAIGIALS